MSASGAQGDAAALAALLGADVEVLAEDGKKRRGRLFSVDPVSRSLVLLQGRVTYVPPDALSADAVQVVVGRAVKSVEVATPLSELVSSPEEAAAWSPSRRLRLLGFAPEPPRSEPVISEEESARRRAALVAHLEKHFVPVESSPGDSSAPADLRVLGCLTVGPPYTAEACRSANVLVLDRVRRLVRELADTGWGAVGAEGGAPAGRGGGGGGGCNASGSAGT